MELGVDARVVRGCVVAALPDEIDIANIRDVRIAVLDSLSSRTRGLVLDLTNTKYFDSKGIHLLIELDQLLRRSRQGFRLVAHPAGPVVRLLELTGLSIAIADTIEDALAALRETGNGEAGAAGVDPEAS